MSSHYINVGIVGGGFGRAVHLPAFEGLPEVRVNALADHGSGRMSGAGGEHTAARKFSNGLDLVGWEGVDAVAIAVPPTAQSALVSAAVEHGKAVLCEKPLGLSVDEASKLLDAARIRGAATAIGYQFRYDSGIKALVDATRRGIVGPVRHIAVAWLTSGGMSADRVWSWRDDVELGGGVLNEFCSHVIDYAMLIANSRISEVSCCCRTRVTARPCETGFRAVSAPDTCDIWCEFEDGITGHFSVSNAFPVGLGHRVEVFGESGRLEYLHRPPFSAESASFTLQDESGRRRDMPLDALDRSSPSDTRIAAFRCLASDFVDTLRGNPSDLLPRFEDAVAARKVIEACRLSTNAIERFPVRY